MIPLAAKMITIMRASSRTAGIMAIVNDDDLPKIQQQLKSEAYQK